MVFGIPFDRVALCIASGNSPLFVHFAQICDLVKYNHHNKLRLFGGRNLGAFFGVANLKSIASYWYNGRLQEQLPAVSRTLNSEE